jgi:excisionase family DNA binding protein
VRESDFLSVTEAAERLGVGLSAVHNAIHRGHLRALRFRCPCGSHSGPPRDYIAVADVDAYDTGVRRHTRPEIRERILALGKAGLGARAIARTLTEEGIPAPGGGAWIDATVGKILTALGPGPGRGARTDLAPRPRGSR